MKDLISYKELSAFCYNRKKGVRGAGPQYTVSDHPL